jgi:hypothetical protein
MSVEEPPDLEEVHEFAQATESCLEHRNSITNVLSSLYSRYLSDEDIQEELNKMFSEYDMVEDLVRFVYENDGIEEFFEIAEEINALDPDQIEEIRNLWTEIQWISDGFRAAILADQGIKYWTDVDAEITTDGEHNHDLVLRQQLNWGANEVYTASLPVAVYFRQLRNRIDDLGDQLGRVNADSVGTIVEEEELIQTRRNLMDLVEHCHQIDEQLSSLAVENEPTIEHDVFEVSPASIIANEISTGKLDVEHLNVDNETRRRLEGAETEDDIHRELTAGGDES